MTKVVILDTSNPDITRDAVIRAGVNEGDVFATKDAQAAREHIAEDTRLLLTNFVSRNNESTKIRRAVLQFSHVALGIVSMADAGESSRKYLLDKERTHYFLKDAIFGPRSTQRQEFENFVRASVGIEG